MEYQQWQIQQAMAQQATAQNPATESKKRTWDQLLDLGYMDGDLSGSATNGLDGARPTTPQMGQKTTSGGS